jgi:hypothetical protein
LCFYVTQCWCNDDTSKSPDLESIFIHCKPFYSPREFSSVILAVDYRSEHLCTHRATSTGWSDQRWKENTQILLWPSRVDFNHTSLQQELPRYKHLVKCSTSQEKYSGPCLQHF